MAKMIELPKKCSVESFNRRQRIAKAILDLRLDLGISREEAAASCKVSLVRWNGWEQGKTAIPVERLNDINVALRNRAMAVIKPLLLVAA